MRIDANEIIISAVITFIFTLLLLATVIAGIDKASLKQCREVGITEIGSTIVNCSIREVDNETSK